MLSFLKNHPFSVEAYFECSTVLTFAVKKDELESFVPECLTLDTFNDEWAFIAVALVKTKGLRPKGFPSFMGNDFYLAGYRIFVRYSDNRGRKLRGLYILKSETDKKKMEFFGNIFTHYNYTTTDIEQTKSANFKTIKSAQSKFEISIELTDGEIKIPEKSPFTDWKDARKFAGPLPHTFTVNTEDKTILTILGIRQNWKPKPIKVENYHFDFLNNLKFQNIVLANAFEIKNVPYSWEKGKIEKWK